MGHSLTVFPGMTSAASQIVVDVARHPGHLTLRYDLTGAIDGLLLPPFAEAKRTDELWKHTCFEAFIRPATGAAYYEFNLAPSTQWAAYGFSATRENMHNVNIKPSRIEAEQSAQSYVLSVLLDLSDLAEFSNDVPLHLNLSAVIEEKNGRKSYWALAHPADKPDFHNSDCFTLELPAA